jgi:hypothetical protein
VYHVDKYRGNKKPGWEEWLIIANDITVELAKRIEEIRAPTARKRGAKGAGL